MSTAAAAPTLGPTGSWPSVTSAIRTAVASSSEASTPTAFSRSQLRKICANTATSTNPTTRLPPLRLRSTASPRHSSRPLPSASRRSPALSAAITATPTSGSHHGRPSGTTSVNDASAASAASTARIGNSAATSVGTCGATSGDDRRSAAMRAATPRCPFKTPPSTCMLDARYRTRRGTVPPAASIVMCHASLRDTSATTCSSVVIAIVHRDALDSAAVNSSRRPARSTTRRAATASEPAIVIAVRRRLTVAAVLTATAVLALPGPDRDDVRGLHAHALAAGGLLEPGERARAAARGILELLAHLIERAADLDGLPGGEHQVRARHLGPFRARAAQSGWTFTAFGPLSLGWAS